LGDALARKKLDAFFFSGVSDLYYLTGFHSEGFYGLASAKQTWLFASALLAGQVRENAPGCRLLVGKRLTVALEELRKKHRLKKVGFDPEQIPYRLGALLVKGGLTPQASPLEDLRIVKSAEEMERLARACRITAQTVEDVKRRVQPGQTERQIARAVQAGFDRRGGEGPAFDLIAAVGPNTALPHHVPGEARAARNGPVLLDVGTKVGPYRSDLTRTFYLGRMPPSFRRVYGVVEAAQKAGIARVRPGSTGGQVDAASRGVISRAGFSRRFIHSTGHGVGIDIHEPPWNRPKSPDVYKSDMVVTVEPGIYLTGRFGVRIEDTIRVVPGGHAILTQA
jgi:Xaa-Pro aminopeptidase